MVGRLCGESGKRNLFCFPHDGAAWRARKVGEDFREATMVDQQIVFRDLQLKVENVEVFPFNATNVPLAENTCAECPMDILECGIV